MRKKPSIKKINQTQEEGELAILRLMQDIKCLDQLKQWTEKINIFHVLKIARTEIRHSNMLAWLLDPSENHGLGSDFLQAFITDLSKPHSYESATDDYDAILVPQSAIDLLSSDLTNAQVFREWNRIDLLIKLPKGYLFAIENKVDSTESKDGTGESQLHRYSKILNKYYGKNNESKIIKVFLTVNGDKPSDENQDWKVYTYSDVLMILKEVFESHQNRLSPEAQLLISHYIDILTNEIMNDDRLKNLCNEIYQKHKIAFDLIYENRDSVTSMASLICFNKLNSLPTNENNFIELQSSKPSVYIKFTTTGSRSFKEQLHDIDVYYQYEFRQSGAFGVLVKLSLVLHNPSKKYDEQSAKIINKYASKNLLTKDKEWQWKEIWGYNNQFEDVNDELIGGWVEKSIKECIKLESKW